MANHRLVIPLGIESSFSVENLIKFIQDTLTEAWDNELLTEEQFKNIDWDNISEDLLQSLSNALFQEMELWDRYKSEDEVDERTNGVSDIILKHFGFKTYSGE